jgi:hypothetical protein
MRVVRHTHTHSYIHNWDARERGGGSRLEEGKREGREGSKSERERARERERERGPEQVVGALASKDSEGGVQ